MLLYSFIMLTGLIFSVLPTIIKDPRAVDAFPDETKGHPLVKNYTKEFCFFYTLHQFILELNNSNSVIWVSCKQDILSLPFIQFHTLLKSPSRDTLKVPIH